MAKIQQNSSKICEILQKKKQKNAAIFNENFEILELCKGVHYVDIGESFRTHIYSLLETFGFDTAENEPDFRLIQKKKYHPGI